ncbi:hypothetical protein [Cohnella thailandensis]|uniref:DUF4367 domain-containing protein n=1 Tax=Cohnella thailandensis TaxID=557557 RepID=A0A841ST55_9BACL|nr:hypothetical protein [Cohnella thailandensis]MBB6633398.1 hypothetical protein [Cohnella thailandensis]MBP1977259.1 hypothetical protein [Cohnella thailandensis]
MADETKRTGGEAVFDPDRAWERFERLAAGEPIPAIWRQANENRYRDDKDGAITMNQTESLSLTKDNGAYGNWRTERPAKRRLRRISAVAAAAAAAVVLIATPLGDRALGAMQQTFRIQNMVGVGITADDLSSISGLLERGSPDGERSFDLAQYGTLTQSGGGESRTVAWEEAESRMGSSLLRLDSSAAPSFQPAAMLTFRLNAKAVNRLLTRLGGTTELPDEADGKSIALSIPDGVASEGELAGKPARLLQFGKPELTVEDGIDAGTVREAILGLPVLPDSLRTKLAAIGDWQSTLPIPARDGVTSSFRLDGRDAVMTADDNRRYLVWLDGSRISLLSVTTQDFPTEAAFRQAAEELVSP